MSRTGHTVFHSNGSPDGCSEECSANNRHSDDPPIGTPEVCERCGGNGLRCFPVCRDTHHRYQWSEGLTSDGYTEQDYDRPATWSRAYP